MRITAAVTGHLPVMSGLWATQFADRVGAADGPTGLIRCERELVHVEIMRGGGRHIGLRQGEDLIPWLRRAARLVRRWVVCIPTSAEPQTVLDSGFADAVLLTSADEAAVAAAQRVIESIGTAAANLGLPCALGVVVVGAPPERVQWMANELGAHSPRSVDLPLAGAIQRMDRVESSERYGFEAVVPPSTADLLRTLESAAHEAVERMHGDGVDMDRRPPMRRVGRPPATATETEPRAHEARAAAQSREAEALALARAAEPPVAAPTLDATVARPAAHAPPAPPVDRAAAFERGTPFVAPRPADLSPLIAGLAALDMRCPSAPAVELAHDRAGRLHLVTAVEHLAALAGARRWAELNAPLLVRAFPALASSSGAVGTGGRLGPIVERVVTLDATQVESLHGGGMALDLLVEFRVLVGSGNGAMADAARNGGHGASQWRHVPLNAAATIDAAPVASGVIAAS